MVFYHGLLKQYDTSRHQISILSVIEHELNVYRVTMPLFAEATVFNVDTVVVINGEYPPFSGCILACYTEEEIPIIHDIQ
jgi:hypothetical protein